MKTKMKFFFFAFVFTAIALSSCMKSKQADLIVHNAVIHSMDEQLTIYEAMAIKDGKIIELGPQRQILNKYSAKKVLDAQNKELYPGLSDAHVHMILAAKQGLQVDLSECRSFDELLLKLERHHQTTQSKIIVGNGWNEQTWTNPYTENRDTEMLPDKIQLDSLFPDTPICLIRYDGHTALVNQAMLNVAQIDEHTKINGGAIEQKNGRLTGVISDNALEHVRNFFPPPSKRELSDKIIEIQNEYLMYGVTNVHEAAVEYHEIDLLKKLIDDARLHLNVYAMLLPSDSNIAFVRKNGIYQHKNLTIRSLKVFADGALGSWGAWMHEPYADRPKSRGFPTVTIEKMQEIAQLCMQYGYQLNTHAIGDATVKMVLDVCEQVQQTNADHRWRIEHAQIVEPSDLQRFSTYGIIPSVQPIHALGDHLFAQQRLGPTRIHFAYAYRDLLDATGILAIGTDFPIESNDPFLTIYAACKRKNQKNEPKNGFFSQQAISVDECLKGMTTWAAVASFQENKIGKLEVGMDATFAIFERKIQVSEVFQPNFARYTYINGKEVYSAE